MLSIQNVLVHQALLYLGFEDAVELVEYDGFIDNTSDDVALCIPLCLEVSGECGIPALLADGDGFEAFGNGTVTCVKRGMGSNDSDFRILEVVFLKVAQNLVSADHINPCSG